MTTMPSVSRVRRVAPGLCALVLSAAAWTAPTAQAADAKPWLDTSRTFEARAASLLRSPNIAVTYDIGEHGGSDFIVMEYVAGESLASRIASAWVSAKVSRRSPSTRNGASP